MSAREEALIESLRREVIALDSMNQLLRHDLQNAVYRINDMLHDPDGQSFKEAERWVGRVCYVHSLKNEPQPKGESNG